MGIGVSIFLIAVGAILTFAVNATVSGVSIQTVGVILMIAGALGLIVTLMIFAPRRRASVVRERSYDDRPPVY
jgi:Flp pilus assembly protein protease CpaA